MGDKYFEQQLFDWSEWDEAGGDYGDILFHDCVLKKDFHQFKKGATFRWVLFSPAESVLEFGTSDDEIYTFKLILDTATTEPVIKDSDSAETEDCCKDGCCSFG